MIRMLLIILLAILTSLLFSCRNIQCNNTYITPVFVGFPSGDLDTIVLRKFKAGSDFQVLEDTTIFTNNDTVAAYYTSNDTTIVEMNIISGEYKYLLPGDDWQVYLPAKNVTVLVSNIASPQMHIKCFGDCGCVNQIDSFMQNGNEEIPRSANIPDFGVGNVMYIHL
jgi:uncharacterized protein YaiE (UPF0345 family)